PPSRIDRGFDSASIRFSTDSYVGLKDRGVSGLALRLGLCDEAERIACDDVTRSRLARSKLTLSQTARSYGHDFRRTTRRTLVQGRAAREILWFGGLSHFDPHLLRRGVLAGELVGLADRIASSPQPQPGWT